MRTELEVTNINLSQTLKDAGASQQDKLYYWKYVTISQPGSYYTGYKLYSSDSYTISEEDLAAYTLRELGELIQLSNNQPMFTFNPDIKQWCAQFLADACMFNTQTEIESRTKVALYLLNHKMIEV